MCQAVICVHNCLDKRACLLCVCVGGLVHVHTGGFVSGGFVPQALVFLSPCVIDIFILISAFVHLCVSM